MTAEAGPPPPNPGTEPQQGVLVTVLIVTYNHERYIAAAIESALSQRTDFPVEVLVSEDASTDGTREIVKSYAALHPGRIRLMLSEGNIASNETVARGLRIAKGQFVALLDGDDCWLSPDKLQRQADYLRTHPEAAAHFFNARIAQGDIMTETVWTPAHQARHTDLAAIWHGNPYATAGGMMRLDAIREVPAWYQGFFPRTDWPLYILCAEWGTLDFDPEPAALYRLHDGGLFSALSEARKLDSTLAFLTRMDHCLDGRYRQLAAAGCSRLFYDWAVEYAGKGQTKLAAKAWAYALRGGGIGDSVSWRQALRLPLQIAKRAVFG